MPLTSAGNTITTHGRIIPTKQKYEVKSWSKSTFGLKFKLDKGTPLGGFFNKISGVTAIKNAVKQLLLTTRGERLMLPDFGCNLQKFLFQPLDEDTFEQIKEEITTSFSKYIVGARLVKLRVFPSDAIGPYGGNSLQVVLTLEINESELEVFDVEVVIS